MKLKKDYTTYLLACFVGLAICLVTYVLFICPQPGVADQGDFDRVMSVSGLELTAQNKLDPNFDRFFKYIVTDYKITNADVFSILKRITASSITYPITIINFLCTIIGGHTFKTNYLAAFYTILYICSFYMIIKYLNFKSRATFVLFSLLCLLIFFDGNYLVWFNSLYGEPMMITTLLLYISSWLYYFYYKYILKTDKKILTGILFIFITAFLYLGSKMQVITSLPIIIIMLGKLLWENRYLLKRTQLFVLCLSLGIILAYPLEINISNRGINNDIQYNSVFYGVLKDSKNPKQDLIDMGLNPDMAVEAGKHSYLDEKEYVKYVPHSELTQKEFYSKMSKGKLITFYITHPMRLIQGMEYTATHAFYTGTSLGHYVRSYSEKPIKTFDRFTLWSSLKEALLPKSLAFIILIYCSIIGLSIFTYIKNKDTNIIKGKIELLWSIMFIGLMQFPMPFIGNGQADTTKQLFLFDFIFDIILVVSISWIFYMFIKLKPTKNKA